MIIVHYNKSGGVHEIPVDMAQALDPTAFATYSERKGDTITHKSAAWKLASLHEGKYKEHHFEFRFTPEELDRLIAGLEIARERFKTAAIPGKEVEDTPT